MSRSGMMAALAAMALAAPAASAQATLDRAALLKLSDDYIAALVAHDPGRVALASDARIVENVRRVKPGEGMWKNAGAALTEFRIVAADPVSQQVGGLVVMQSEGNPVQFGSRLKVAGGRITEAEHLVVPIRDVSSPNLQKARPGFAIEVPYEYADSRGRLVYIAKTYYDAVDNNNGSLAPFAADCERRENGFRAAPNGGTALTSSGFTGGPPQREPGLLGMLDCTAQLNTGTFQYIDRIENRRVEVADTVTGIAIGFSHFRHPMTQKKFVILNNPDRPESDMSTQRAFDMPAMHVYKIWDGRIHEIEAIGITTDYNSPTGWE